MKVRLILAGLALLVTSQLHAASKVFLIEPGDNAEVVSPFLVRFGLEGMNIGPVGNFTPGTGHHHLLINRKTPEKGEILPFDATHMHFGKGQTEAELTLPPGEYTLTLQFSDGLHRAYGPEMSHTIRVRVK